MNILHVFSFILASGIIIVLFVYIFSLHKQLKTKNDFIESMLNKVLDNAQNMSKEDVFSAMKSMNQFNMPSLSKDKILDESVLSFVFEGSNDVHLFAHYTKEENIANLIISEGFRFANSFYKTAENIYLDKVDFAYRHHLHKKFGSYVIIIGIARTVYNKYFEQLKLTDSKNILVEQIMVEELPKKDENFNETYLLPRHYIKGFFNYETGTITLNQAYNPTYDSYKFAENIKLRS